MTDSPQSSSAASEHVLMPRDATREMTMAGCDSLPSCEHVFGHAGEMLRNAYRRMVEVGNITEDAESIGVREALKAALAEHEYKKTQQVMLTEPRWVEMARDALSDRLPLIPAPAQPTREGKSPEWFCQWLKGYLGGIPGRDELDAFEANSIRNTLNEVLAAQPPAAPVETKCDCLPWPDKCPYCGGDAPVRRLSAATGDASNIVPPYKFPLRVSGDSIVDDTGGYVASLSSPHGADARGEMVCFLVNAANASAFDRRATQPQTSVETEQDLREQNLRGLLREARDYVEVADTDHSASLLNDINDTLSLTRPNQP